MAILVNSDTNLVLQGCCTRKGSLLLDHIIDYNSNLCAGVCYLNTSIKSQRGVPFFNNLGQAMLEFPFINASIVASSAYEVAENCMEALDHGIKLIIIATEFVPLRDMVLISIEAQKHAATVIGPNSAGIINPDIVLAGSMGGIHSLSVFKKGNVGIVSRSNGLVNEVAIVLKNTGLGVSTAIALGTEKILLYSFTDAYKHFMDDPETKSVVMIGGPGWHGEEEFASYYSTLTNPKPVIAFLVGHFIDDLTKGFYFGHLSNIKDETIHSVSHKKQKLESAGIQMVKFIQDIPTTIKSLT